VSAYGRFTEARRNRRLPLEFLIDPERIRSSELLPEPFKPMTPIFAP